jgi:hypothetical protein
VQEGLRGALSHTCAASSDLHLHHGMNMNTMDRNERTCQAANSPGAIKLLRQGEGGLLEMQFQAAVPMKAQILTQSKLKLRGLRCSGSHIVQIIDSEMAVRLSALRTGRALFPRNITFLFLVLILLEAE